MVDKKEQICRDFEGLHSRLRHLEQVYNPSNEDLHFAKLNKADAELCSQLLELAKDGLETVQKHRDYFSKEALYGDGMFWYDLFLMISSSALKVKADRSQRDIPENIIKQLALVLVEISEFSTVHIGDIIKRNYEALGNTLLCFYSKELIDMVQERSLVIESKLTVDFVNHQFSYRYNHPKESPKYDCLTEHF